MAASIRISTFRYFRQRPANASIVALHRYHTDAPNNIKNTIPVACYLCHNQRRFKRSYSSNEPEDKVVPPSRPRRYALNKVVTFLSSSIDRLETRLPRVFKVYITAKTGIRSFIGDAKEYYRITRQLWSGQSLAEFSRKDLELYRQCSSDLPVMTIALIISLAPGGILIFPIAYMFPRLLLSHHFWTAEQKQDFLHAKAARQSQLHGKLRHLLERKLVNVTPEDSRLGLQSVLRKVESNTAVSASEVLKLHFAFEERPFGTDFLSIWHRYHLGRSLGLPWQRRQKLVRGALLLHFTDMAMVREGVASMTDEEIDRACVWRGLNPQGLKAEEKLEYLRSWTAVSSLIHEPSVSLLLHLPVLLSHTHQTNHEVEDQTGEEPRP